MRLTLLVLFVIGNLAFTVGQSTNPGENNVFRPNELAIIRLTLSPEDKAFLLDPANVESEEYLEADFSMTNSLIDTTLEIKVGVRLRGNTSRYHNKKPFKIDFREFGGGKFFDCKKFNLKPNTNDPSQIREPLTLHFYRLMDVPAARTHPVIVYMNDEYMGTYINVEQVDDEFLNRRFGHEDGFLYKCGYGANLQHNGQVYNEIMFESKINEEDDTRAEIDHFTNVLNNTTNANFVTEIEKVFEVNRYLRQLAVEALTGHWDGYSWNQNNFYLHFNEQSGLVEFFPYDADNTWGIDWVGGDWGVRDVNNWAKSGEPRPLTTRILNVPAYREKYEEYLIELLDNYFTEDYLGPLLNDHKEFLGQAVQEDTYFDDSFGFTYNDFLNSFTQPMDNHVQYGILEFVQVRRQAALEQLGLVLSAESSNSNLTIYPNPSHARRFFIHSEKQTFSQPTVTTSLGFNVNIETERIDDQTVSVALPEFTSSGLYFIRVDGKLLKWICH